MNKPEHEHNDETAPSFRDIQLATLNILEDFNTEKERLEETQRAVLNILDDFSIEKGQYEGTQKATLNILEDFNTEKERLEDMQRALLNILDDLNQSSDELKKAHDVLEARVKERTAELARSNAELEQFAYIASHDLQEPLRMVSSYVQLLGRRYQGKLDKDADEFIAFASEGAIRMQRLINDLLAYSRVGTRGKSFEEVNLEAVLARALENLQLALKEKSAAVTHDPLPTVFGDVGQLTQVFQNLIDNAVKFRADAPPRVHISARLEGSGYICSVKDNGIGIAPEFVNRLFVLFQRLHTRRDYPGTGIGLAICKRIVERHGGKIWVESRPGEGSTFFFQIAAARRSHDNG
jgi:light-regulated signal transduction histidine kinase (bacteriophytochrome)